MNELITKALPRFMKALFEQLESDFERWGDEWKNRPREGQEKRIFERFTVYYNEWTPGPDDPFSTPVPWLKIAGLALIAWWREEREKK